MKKYILLGILILAVYFACRLVFFYKQNAGDAPAMKLNKSIRMTYLNAFNFSGEYRVPKIS